MHELYIADSILKSVEQALPEGIPSSAVRRVEVKLGRLDAVNSNNLCFLFDTIKGNYAMPWAELWIENVDVWGLCGDCQSEFQIDTPVFICPVCKSGNVEVTRGRGITLNLIQVEDQVSA